MLLRQATLAVEVVLEERNVWLGAVLAVVCEELLWGRLLHGGCLDLVGWRDDIRMGVFKGESGDEKGGATYVFDDSLLSIYNVSIVEDVLGEVELGFWDPFLDVFNNAGELCGHDSVDDKERFGVQRRFQRWG